MQPAGYVILTLEFRKEDGQWLGRCREIGTSTFADTLEQVKNELRELIALHLNALEDAGERRRFFRENNIRFYENQPTRVQRTLSLDDENEYIQLNSFPIRQSPMKLAACAD